MEKKSKKNWDAIVLGAGMAGLGAALGLARRGRKVLVISKKLEGASSPAAGGILDPFLEMSPGHPLFQLSKEAFKQYPSLVRRVETKTGRSVGYKKTGMLFIAMNPKEMRELENRYAWQKKSGIPVVWQSRLTILKSNPGVNPKLLGGLFYPTVARIHPKSFTEALTLYAKSLGVRFIRTQKSPQVRFQKDLNLVQIRNQNWATSVLINATGSWAMQGESGPKLPVLPAKGQIVMVRTSEKISTILHSLDGGYIVPWKSPRKKGQQECLLGSTVELVGFKPKPTAQGIGRVLEKNVRILPGLARAVRLQTWAGLRPFSKTKLPMIGPSKKKGFYLAAGYYRSGILISCYAGELLAKAILSGKMPPRLRAFDPRKHSL